MAIPYVEEVPQGVSFNSIFKGYNHNLHIEPGEFYEMRNVTTDNYPVLTTRPGQNEQREFTGRANGIFEYEDDTLMVVAGKKLYTGITPDSDGRQEDAVMQNNEKSFAKIGSKVVIMPDKKIYDTKTGEVTNIVQFFESMGRDVGTGTSAEKQVTVVERLPCEIDGTVISGTNYTRSSSKPTGASGKYWYNTSDNTLRKWSEATNNWVKMESAFMRLRVVIMRQINTNDSQTFDSPSQALDADLIAHRKELSDYLGTLKAYDSISLAYTNGTNIETTDNVIFNVGESDGYNYIVVQGSPSTTYTHFTFRNKCPDLTYIAAHNNRVWGVSNSTHEIFACKLGDPTQWYNYPGISSDSYAATIGGGNDVTGCISYANQILFFTERKIIKVYGDYPSNFTIGEIVCDGVKEGANKTLQIVEGLLYYVSSVGVMAYDGSMPVVISHKFAPHWLDGKTLCAGVDRTKYCLSVSQIDESYGIFVYDTTNGLWCIEGDQIMMCTTTYQNSLIFLNKNSKMVSLHDKSMKYDLIGAIGRELLDLQNRQPVSDFLFDLKEYDFEDIINDDGTIENVELFGDADTGEGE